MFYDRFSELCKKRGISVTKATVEIGLSRTIGTAWKNRGLTPKADTLQKIADYFGVTTDYLLGSETEKAPTPEGERSLPYAAYREVLSEGGVRLLLDADAKLPEEHLEEIVEFIKMKQRKYGR